MSTVIGLTGGIGSGKTAMTNYLKKKGFPVIDTDLIAREVVAPKSEGLNKVIKAFGSEYLNFDKSLNREKLRELIFNDPQKKKQLESLLHPLIQDQTKQQIATRKTKKKPYVFVAIPLLIELILKSGKPDYIDEIWVIQSDQEYQITRASHRDDATAADIKNIINQQATAEQRIKYADRIIENNADLPHLYQQIDCLIKVQH